jgi:hypothetical protein
MPRIGIGEVVLYRVGNLSSVSSRSAEKVIVVVDLLRFGDATYCTSGMRGCGVD